MDKRERVRKEVSNVLSHSLFKFFPFFQYCNKWKRMANVFSLHKVIIWSELWRWFEWFEYKNAMNEYVVHQSQSDVPYSFAKIALHSIMLSFSITLLFRINDSLSSLIFLYFLNTMSSIISYQSSFWI